MSDEMTTVHIVFGACGVTGENLVRVDGPHFKTDEVSTEEIWPEAELHHGVGSITIDAHGDDPDGVFVKVRGIDRERVEGVWRWVMDQLAGNVTHVLWGE